MALLTTLLPPVLLLYISQLAIIIFCGRTHESSAFIAFTASILISLSLPYLHAQASGQISSLTDYLSAPRPGEDHWYWRQSVLSLAVLLWEFDGQPNHTKLQSSPYSPQKHRTSFWRILHSTLIQSTHTALRMLPLLTLNALPRSAFTIARIQNITDTLPMPLSAHRYSTDLIGIMLSFSGPIFQIVADTDNFLWRKGTGYTKHMNRSKNAGTATSRMALHAYNFGEVMVWTGMAVVCGGILLKEPALAALGLAGWSGKMVVIEICAASPVATAVRLWMECEGESEEMRTEDAHIE